MPAAFLVGMGFVPCTETHVAVILMCFGIGTLGFTYSGQMVNDLDIAYPFAGTILGIAYSFATISGIIAPYVTQVITQQVKRSFSVFFAASAVYKKVNDFCDSVFELLLSFASKFIFQFVV